MGMVGDTGARAREQPGTSPAAIDDVSEKGEERVYQLPSRPARARARAHRATAQCAVRDAAHNTQQTAN